MHWIVHRVALKYPDGLHLVETEWSLQDVLDANAVLDELDRIQAEAEDGDP